MYEFKRSFSPYYERRQRERVLTLQTMGNIFAVPESKDSSPSLPYNDSKDDCYQHVIGTNGTTNRADNMPTAHDQKDSYCRDDLTIWYVHIDEIKSMDDHQPVMLSLTPEERTKVKRFMFVDDQKRALLSILLQRALIHHQFGWFPNANSYEVRRSLEGKPYIYRLDTCSNHYGVSVVSDATPHQHLQAVEAVENYGKRSKKREEIGTWNYNVSHHGNYVCIVSHSDLLMGADIVDLEPKTRLGMSCKEFSHMFEKQLTRKELQTILRQPTEKTQFAMFNLYWSLKEAFIKAIGQGLGYNLKEVEFDVNLVGGMSLSVALLNPTSDVQGSATVRVRGQLRHDWRMDFHALDDTHVLSIARGPLSDALPSFQQLASWSWQSQPSTPPLQLQLQLQQQYHPQDDNHRMLRVVEPLVTPLQKCVFSDLFPL
mmetsp:Transcript_1538/g.2546  ORF Transcript_1538/g.2546 Transcript_1538/m.2546 type:complete len:428 (-) Transcript_1538:131-1414(-)